MVHVFSDDNNIPTSVHQEAEGIFVFYGGALSVIVNIEVDTPFAGLGEVIDTFSRKSIYSKESTRKIIFFWFS